MAVPAVNLTIEKGADFSTALKIKTDGSVIDLTGYTFAAKMRKHPAASTYYTFSVSALPPLSSGVVRLQMTEITTSQIPVGRYIWDLLITISGVTTKAAKGTVIVEGTAS
jgi:hypothetical protein